MNTFLYCVWQVVCFVLMYAPYSMAAQDIIRWGANDFAVGWITIILGAVLLMYNPWKDKI